MKAIQDRVSKLEGDISPEATCRACGSVDFATGTGTFRPGLLLREADGSAICFCKRCGRTFRARLDRPEEWDPVRGGAISVSEAVPAELPFVSPPE